MSNASEKATDKYRIMHDRVKKGGRTGEGALKLVAWFSLPSPSFSSVCLCALCGSFFHLVGILFPASCFTSPLAAQVVRLPAVMPSEQTVMPSQRAQPNRLVSHPDSAAEVLQAPGEPGLPQQPELPPDARPGMFQKLIFDGQWLPRGGSDGLGFSSLQLKTVLALPVPSRQYPLIITPGFGVHYFDGPAGPDLPPRVYDAYTQFRWMRRLGTRWGIDLAVTPGVFGDFQRDSGENFRVTGHAVAAWTYTPATKFVLGVAYIDRMSTPVLPVCGLIWTPHDDVKFELVFPHPRIARRIYTFGACTDDVQDWLYVAGEFGGGIWAVEQTSGAIDQVDYTDFRVVLGLQRKVIGGLDAQLEAAYVFGREIRYASGTPGLEPADTVMLRGGVTY